MAGQALQHIGAEPGPGNDAVLTPNQAPFGPMVVYSTPATPALPGPNPNALALVVLSPPLPSGRNMEAKRMIDKQAGQKRKQRIKDQATCSEDVSLRLANQNLARVNTGLQASLRVATGGTCSANNATRAGLIELITITSSVFQLASCQVRSG